MRSLLTVIATFFCTTIFAQPITGDWYGALDVKGSKLHLVFHIIKTANGYLSTMDSPDQGAKGLKLDSTAYANNVLVMAMIQARIKYVGTLDEATGTITGQFEQGSNSLPLILTRQQPVEKQILRPQEPKDFPYVQEEVKFVNTKDSVTLAGTLTLPKDKQASKIVILVTGSGPQNRDEEMKQFHHKPFLVLSDWLTRHGIAVLRYDDRGVGGSTGNFKKATTADFATDAAAAVDYISSRADLKSMDIGILGHSEGGMVAPMVAANDKRVKYIVLLAGPGAPIDELMVTQSRKIQTLAKAPQNIIDLNLAAVGRAYTYLKANRYKSNAAVEPELQKIMEEEIAKYPADALEGSNPKDMARQQVQSFLSPWFRYFICYVPAENISKVKCPVLAMNGTLDMQVDAQQNLPAIEAALKKGKNKKYEVVPMPGLNHLLQKAPTGNPSEYGEIEETMNEEAMKKVSEWVNGL